MKTTAFKSTTAIAVALSMAMPLPAAAQAKRAEIDISTMTGAEISEVVSKCKKRADRRQKKIDAGEEPADKRGPVAKFCEAYSSGAFDAQLPLELQSAVMLNAGDQAAAAEAEAEAGSDEPAAEAEAEAGAQAEVQAETDVQAAAQAEAEASAASGADTVAQAESQEPDSQAAAGADAASEAQAESSSGAEAGASGEATADAAEDAQNQAAAGTAAQTGGEAGAAAEGDAQVQAESDNSAEAELEPVDSQAQADAVAAAAAETETAAAAAAAAEGGTGEAEVIEETVTEETSRSSDEEFQTTVNEDAAPEAAAAPGAAPADEDDGLSDIQRAALLGLGALAVGKLLNSGEKVVSNSGDRAVVEQNGQYRVLKNDDALLRQPGSDVTTYRYEDGSTRTVVVRENGTEVETIRAADGRVLRRTRTLEDGSTVVLFDDTQRAEEVVVTELPQQAANQAKTINYRNVDADDLAAALAAQQAQAAERRFSLSQVRGIDAVRRLVPEINVDSINFETGSAVIRPDEAQELAALGNALRKLIDQNPREVFLIEGHTDAVGAASYNLALSDRRAETVALALTEYFNVPPENLVVQGYGESDLAVQTTAAERANRRAAVRRITPLLQSGS